MLKQLLELFLSIGLFFGLIGGLMAYLITYNEYTHHFQDKARPRQMALSSGLFTFVFLLVLLFLAGWILLRFGG